MTGVFGHSYSVNLDWCHCPLKAANDRTGVLGHSYPVDWDWCPCALEAALLYLRVL